MLRSQFEMSTAHSPEEFHHPNELGKDSHLSTYPYEGNPRNPGSKLQPVKFVIDGDDYRVEEQHPIIQKAQNGQTANKKLLDEISKSDINTEGRHYARVHCPPINEEKSCIERKGKHNKTKICKWNEEEDRCSSKLDFNIEKVEKNIKKREKAVSATIKLIIESYEKARTIDKDLPANYENVLKKYSELVIANGKLTETLKTPAIHDDIKKAIKKNIDDNTEELNKYKPTITIFSEVNEEVINKQLEKLEKITSELNKNSEVEKDNKVEEEEEEEEVEVEVEEEEEEAEEEEVDEEVKKIIKNQKADEVVLAKGWGAWFVSKPRVQPESTDIWKSKQEEYDAKTAEMIGKITMKRDEIIDYSELPEQLEKIRQIDIFKFNLEKSGTFTMSESEKGVLLPKLNAYLRLIEKLISDEDDFIKKNVTWGFHHLYYVQNKKYLPLKTSVEEAKKFISNSKEGQQKIIDDIAEAKRKEIADKEAAKAAYIAKAKREAAARSKPQAAAAAAAASSLPPSTQLCSATPSSTRPLMGTCGR